ncbi:TrmB family transcriptional regulator [Methanolobus profundi]|uniref:Sugar-specific transcriptional regulator TrmB n=1 Tax=Methanolobus profundi TaxID=487685 RepID=A0A1I4NR91_9EURY|nr:helix-turn-helix domain-containing protein [Methanolobus profundi]SFM18038.1 Sugar-specific transcriptional regulator TrmB [Methanolobus profundi]
MDTERELRDLGLTKYEASAYSTLLKEGVSGAQELSRKSEIPVGKIYEVLSNLNNMGLVEFQRSRPRQYRAVKPTIALNNLYSKKEEESRNELENFKLRVADLETKLSDISQPDHTEIQFWSTLIGEEDIIKNIKSMLDETEMEIVHVKPGRIAEMLQDQKCVDPKTLIPTVIDEFVKAAEKGIKIKTIVPEDMFTIAMKEKFEQIHDPNTRTMIKKNMEVRVLECEYDFILIDEYITYIPIPEPLQPKKLFGELKVYDREYAGKLRDKFEDLWLRAEKVNINL